MHNILIKNPIINIFNLQTKISRSDFWVAFLGLVGVMLAILILLPIETAKISFLVMLIPVQTLICKRFADVGLPRSHYGIYLASISGLTLLYFISFDLGMLLIGFVSIWFAISVSIALTFQLMRQTNAVVPESRVR